MTSKKIIKKIVLALVCLSIALGYSKYMPVECWVKADTLNTYTVMYNANRGYGVPYSQTKYYNEPLQLSTTEPSRNGYIFMGWGLDSSSSIVVYKPGAMYVENSNITLYAIWGKKDNNGNVVSSTNTTSPSGVNKVTVSSKTVTYGTKSFNLNAKSAKGGILTYTSNNKKVATISKSGKVYIKGYGKATITVKSSVIGNFTADTKKVTIKVIPKKMKLKKVTSPAKKRIKVSWKTDNTVTGYQINISRVMNFSRNTQAASISAKTRNKITKKGLKSKKTYYVRIRAYKKIGKSKYYGKWSKVKRIKVK